MKIEIEITEQPNGDIAVHIHEPTAHVTVREGRYADAIGKSLKKYLATEMPNIARAVRKLEDN